MEGQAVTTNPWLIMAINMTVVFVVLILFRRFDDNRSFN